ncbi:MAG TPA: hypothetical protein VM053_09055 [Gemmatimonadaceae bacterium]|nr:hypothetical protein [Gemmatimonadaceae bacterium]
MSAMIIRTAFIGAFALVVSAGAANAQGKATTQVVISKAVLKSMVANKKKSKAPLGARIGMVKRSSVVAAKPQNLPPTSVKGIPIARGK